MRQRLLALGPEEYFDTIYSSSRENTLRQYASHLGSAYGRKFVVAKDRMVKLRVIRTA